MQKHSGTSIFISYSRKDSSTVFSFVKRVEKELRLKCWIDKEGLESGALFEDLIPNAILNSRVLLYMLSADSAQSDWVKKEVTFAARCQKKVVPVILDGSKLPEWFLFHLGNLNYIDIRNPEHCKRLLADLKKWTQDVPKICDGHTNEKTSEASHEIMLELPFNIKIVFRKDAKSDNYVGEVPMDQILKGLEQESNQSSGFFSSVIDKMVDGTKEAISRFPIFFMPSVLPISNQEKKKIDYNAPKEELEKNLLSGVLSYLNQTYDIQLKEEPKSSSLFNLSLPMEEVKKLCHLNEDSSPHKPSKSKFKNPFFNRSKKSR